MKSLTVRNPWAFWICSGLKDIENRTWSTKFRGKVLIHASKKMEDVETIADEYFDTKMWIDYQNLLFYKKLKTNDTIISYSLKQTNGTIIGYTNIVDCVINHNSKWAEKTPYEDPSISPIYNWVLKDSVLFKEPIFDIKGKLSFWESGFDENYINELDVIKLNG